jgi:hypothetical protein
MAWVQKFVIPMPQIPYQFALELKGDWQLGSRSTCEWKIKDDIDETLERAKTMDSGVLMLGDIEDEDRPSTREIRKKVSAERAEVVERDAEKHISYLESDVLPYLMRLHEGTKYGIVGGVSGHHWTFLPGGAEVAGKRVYTSVEYLFARLEAATGKPCHYLGQMCAFVDLRFQGPQGNTDRTPSSCRSVGFIQHGEGGGQTKASTINKLERAAQGFDAQWYARGHDCQIAGTKTDQLYAREARGDAQGDIGSRTKVMLNLGAATMGYELGRGNPSYVETGMLRPVTVGWGTMLFRIRAAHTDEDPNRNLRADIKLLF